MSGDILILIGLYIRLELVDKKCYKYVGNYV